MLVQIVLLGLVSAAHGRTVTLQAVDSVDVDFQIVNGDPASQGQFPFQGSQGQFGAHNCGCVLIRADRALTAAHCIDSGDAANYQARFGDIDRTQATSYNVTELTWHPDWARTSLLLFPNDIGIMKLATRVSGDNTGLIPYNRDTAVPVVNETVTISGWGRDELGILPTMLQYKDVTYIANSDCRPGNDAIFAGHICFNHPTGASCNGDSGGPATYYFGGDRGNATLVGITSWGRSGCPENVPVGYTRVSYHYQWIIENID